MWVCSACTYRNTKDGAAACEICGTARLGAAASDAGALLAAEAAAAADGWECATCTFWNGNKAALKCAVCSSGRSGCEVAASASASVVSASADAATLVAAQTPQDRAFVTINVAAVLEGLFARATAAAALRKPRIVLCAPVDHVSQKGDAGAGWACGYRNIQMLCSALMKHPPYRAVLFGGTGVVPDVPSLQAWIERAWGLGFDPEGAAQMDRRLQGTRKWVGTCECVALLRSFGINARYYTFHSFDSRYVGQALGAATATRAQEASTAAQAALVSASGWSADQVLRRYAYDSTGALRPAAGGGARFGRLPKKAMKAVVAAAAAGASSSAGSPAAAAAALAAGLAAGGGGVVVGGRIGMPRAPTGGEGTDSLDRDALLASAESLGLIDSLDDAEGLDNETLAAMVQSVGGSTAAAAGAIGGLIDIDVEDEEALGMALADASVVHVGAGALPPSIAASAIKSAYAGAAGAKPTAAGNIGKGAATPGRGTLAIPMDEPSERSNAARRFVYQRHAGWMRWLTEYFACDMVPANVAAGDAAAASGAIRASSGGGASAGTILLHNAGVDPHQRPFPLYLQHDGHSRTLIGFECRQPVAGKGAGKGGGKRSNPAAASGTLPEVWAVAGGGRSAGVAPRPAAQTVKRRRVPGAGKAATAAAGTSRARTSGWAAPAPAEPSRHLPSRSDDLDLTVADDDDSSSVGESALADGTDAAGVTLPRQPAAKRFRSSDDEGSDDTGIGGLAAQLWESDADGIGTGGGVPDADDDVVICGSQPSSDDPRAAVATAPATAPAAAVADAADASVLVVEDDDDDLHSGSSTVTAAAPAAVATGGAGTNSSVVAAASPPRAPADASAGPSAASGAYEVNLLILDPATSKHAFSSLVGGSSFTFATATGLPAGSAAAAAAPKAAKRAGPGWESILKRGLHTLHSVYECAVVAREPLLTGDSLEAAKTLSIVHVYE